MFVTMNRFVGWYHSHPFDVDTQSKCFMSAMDVATQASYQFQLPVWSVAHLFVVSIAFVLVV